MTDRNTKRVKNVPHCMKHYCNSVMIVDTQHEVFVMMKRPEKYKIVLK